MGKAKGYSEQTAQKIDAAIKNIIDTQYATAKRLIVENSDKLEIIANALLEYETLDGWQVEEIVEKGTFTPPPSFDDEDPPKASATLPIQDELPKPKQDDLGDFGSPEPAPI